MEEEILLILKQQLEELAAPVGFEFVGVAESLDETSPPQQTVTWESAFAVIALIPLSSDNDKNKLIATEEIAREWMWRRLTKDERQGKFLDGYLVFAIPKKPDETLRAAVQAIELGTAVCRKHVIWPSGENDWKESLWAVTVLGLPRVQTSVVTSVTSPALPDMASRALELYRKTTNYEAAAEALRAETLSNGKEEPDAS